MSNRSQTEVRQHRDDELSLSSWLAPAVTPPSASLLRKQTHPRAPLAPSPASQEFLSVPHLEVVQGVHLHDRANSVEWKGDLHGLVGGERCMDLERSCRGQTEAGGKPEEGRGQGVSR